MVVTLSQVVMPYYPLLSRWWWWLLTKYSHVRLSGRYLLASIIQISPVLSTLFQPDSNVMPYSSFSIAWSSKPKLFLVKCNTILNPTPILNKNVLLKYHFWWWCSVLQGIERKDEGSDEMTTIFRPRKYSWGKHNIMQHVYLVGEKKGRNP